MDKEVSGTVFISYSSRNRSIAVATRDYLSSLGITCWMAPESITPGEQWAEAIAKIIPNTAIMVLLWTADSMRSNQVINELTLADRSGVMIIPFRLEEIEPEGAFKYYLYKTHWLDAVGNAWKEKLYILGERILHNLPNAVVQPSDSKLSAEMAPQWWKPSVVISCVSILTFTVLALAVSRLQIPTLTPTEPALSEARRGSTSVDQAVDTIQNIYLRLTNREYNRAMELISADIAWQFKPNFFNKFDRVTVQDLRESGAAGSTVNLNGIVNFVWPDGSIQREKRSFSVDTSITPARLTSTEFGGIVQSR